MPSKSWLAGMIIGEQPGDAAYRALYTILGRERSIADAAICTELRDEPAEKTLSALSNRVISAPRRGQLLAVWIITGA